VEKLVYVLWRPPGQDPARFGAALRGPVASRLLALGPRALTLHLADEHAAPFEKARITRLDPPPAGLASFWLDTAEERGPYEEALGAATARLAGYEVVESVPLADAERRAGRGERTPGVVMVALLERPARHGRDAWLERWLVEHKRVALETQSTFAYVRNLVVRALTPEAPPWEAIVEESFPAEVVLDPLRWYRAEGSPERLRENLGRMLESCRAFLDLDRVESHPTSEYRLRE
jgi:hypothetical protein